MTIYLNFKDENGRIITPKVPLDAKPLFPGKTYQEKIYGFKPLNRELTLEKAVMMVENKLQRPLTRLEGPLVRLGRELAHYWRGITGRSR